MKKVCKIMISMIMCVLLLASNTIIAEDNSSPSLATVFATYEGETTEISREVLEIDGSLDVPIHINVKMYGDTSGVKYSIAQYDGKNIRYVVQAASNEFDVYGADLSQGHPTYIVLRDAKNNLIANRLINLRVNKGEVEKKMPTDYGLNFGDGFFVDLSGILPGMEFSFLPFLLPVTVKAYSDGRFVAGFGINSQDVKFWNSARNGTLINNLSNQEMEDAFYGNSDNRKAISGKNMGLVMTWAGYVQGNVFTNEPIRGHMQLFIGTGFDITGQYAILTWEVTVTGGADGSFDFSFVFDEVNSRYTFQPDNFQFGVKGALELFGGLGLAKIFSAGLYGAGSIAVHTEFYPEIDVDHIILAGELGFKVKLLGRSLFTFKFVSGSHDFVHKNGNALMNFSMDTSQIRSYLVSSNYGNAVSVPDEPEGEAEWYTGYLNEDNITNEASLKAGRETDPDFAHKLASNVYSDSQIQIINSGTRSSPEMEIVFLGSDSSRASGNRSRLMNMYYLPTTDFVSDPIPVDYGYEDDGTADFEPYIFKDEINTRTYLVWQNATEPIAADMSFTQIAQRTDICFAEEFVPGNWKNYGRVTEYAGRDHYATGARVASNKDGEPVVSYYLNDVNDPAGISVNEAHEIYLAERKKMSKDEAEEAGLNYQDGYVWIPEKVTEINGAVKEVANAYFQRGQTAVISYTDSEETDRIEMWQNGKKVWSREKATNGRFVYRGFQTKMFTWCENNRLWGMDESGNTWPITPEDMPLSTSDYKLYGKFGSQSVMIVGTSSKDGSENAYAMLSNDGGTSWYRTQLTKIDENALVNHFSVAFTYDDDPIIVYGVQNYEINYDPEDTDAQTFLESGAKGISNLKRSQASYLSLTEDERFTDTTCDLYIKARRSNTHVTILSGEVIDEMSAQYKTMTPVTLRIKNDGLYDIPSFRIYQEGIFLEEIEMDLKRGETADVEVHPYLVGSDDISGDHFDLHLGASTRTTAIESSFTVTVGPGQLVPVVEHVYENGTEKLEYRISNAGFSTKTYTILVRNEKTGEVIFEKKVTVNGQSDQVGSVDAAKGLFVKQGAEDIAFYVLKEGESFDDESVISDRRLHFEPLAEIYGSDISKLLRENTNEGHGAYTVPETDQSSPSAYKLPLTGVEAKDVSCFGNKYLIRQIEEKKSSDLKLRSEAREKKKEEE